jgi:hypothetical protein
MLPSLVQCCSLPTCGDTALQVAPYGNAARGSLAKLRLPTCGSTLCCTDVAVSSSMLQAANRGNTALQVAPYGNAARGSL